jgi:2-aminoadipate transaminase
LAGQLSLNRSTIAAAYRLLEQEGWIRAHVGRGSFVQAGLQNKANSTPIISFASARPPEALFPLSQFRQVTREVLESSQLPRILQLGSPYGYEPLRQWLLTNRSRPGDDLLITNGCQQAIDLLARSAIQPGDAVLVEEPVYPGLREVFLRAGARILPVDVGPDGIDIDACQRAIVRDRPKLAVVTPSFQNPTGATMPLAARMRLLELCRASGVLLVESSIYAELLYEGEPIASLHQLDTSGQVVQLGSFSKIAFPGLRVGWLTGPKSVTAAAAQAKQWSDLHSDQLSQAVLYRFAASGMLEAHGDVVRASLAGRLKACVAACLDHMPPGAGVTHPRGGMNLWVRLDPAISTQDLLAQAEAAGVAYLPGHLFSATGAHRSSLRLSFAGLPEEQIRKGVAILGSLFATQLRRPAETRSGLPAMALV